jgi:hypothetical protein
MTRFEGREARGGLSRSAVAADGLVGPVRIMLFHRP